MQYNSVLTESWEGAPIILKGPLTAMNLAITNIERTDDGLLVTAELYGNVYIDPVTLEETIEYGPVPIMTEGSQPKPGLAFGKSVVLLRQSAEGLEPLSCTYEKYPHPGLDYLKAQTEKLEAALSASEKIDITQYDQRLVEYIWQLIFSHRYIENPEDITLYDLENFRDPLDLPHSSIYDPDAVDTLDPDYRLDASLLRLMPNLEEVVCPYGLVDYSVFENMHSLKKLTLAVDEEVLRTLKVGHTEELVLNDPDVDVLDLSNVDTDILRLVSWTTAVRGFAGCEKIEKLYIMSTRTDMRLVNADTFPDLSYLNLYFYSDTPRVRDFSQLATFDGVKIDLYLDYQACNNQTLESLAGVKLNDVYLTPENGSYPSQDFDRSLADGLNARKISYGMEMYFQERTGKEDAALENRPLFSSGPGSIKVPLGIGEELNGWTLDYVEDYNNLEERIIARFSGEATLKGSIRIHSQEEGWISGEVEFTVAEESLSQLPYYEHDTRTIWFEIANGDMIKQAAGADAGEYIDCEITISGYSYEFAPMLCWNSSTVTEIHRIG
ncbi:hypothetical protein LJC63_04105 [Ruminococcaceae bacterium OttesenSCG-928-L11]|nr:hypothetical protein [Ruminococcaceae bacterium OttesenSCG-928-L11]